MTPTRIQRLPEKGWRTPEGSVSVASPSIWANPYRVRLVNKTTWHVFHEDGAHPLETFISRTGAEAREYAVRRLEMLFEAGRDPWGKDRIRTELAGLDLVCWCPLDQSCHADLLLAIANGSDS